MTDYKCRHLDWCDDGCQQRVAELEGAVVPGLELALELAEENRSALKGHRDIPITVMWAIDGITLKFQMAIDKARATPGRGGSRWKSSYQ